MNEAAPPHGEAEPGPLTLREARDRFEQAYVLRARDMKAGTRATWRIRRETPMPTPRPAEGCESTARAWTDSPSRTRPQLRSRVKEDAGVLVAEVMKDGPAAAVGLKPGDVITGFGGSPIKDVTDLQKRVAAVEPGRPAPITVMRDRKPLGLSVKLGEQPTDEALAAAESGDDVLGLVVEPLTPETARQNRLSARRGLLVTEVTPGSPGAETGDRGHRHRPAAGDPGAHVPRGPLLPSPRGAHRGAPAAGAQVGPAWPPTSCASPSCTHSLRKYATCRG